MRQTTPFDEMDRLFDHMRRSMLDGRHRTNLGGSTVRLESDEDGYAVTADVPGFEPEEIDLRFDDGTLTIDAIHGTDDDGGTQGRRVREQVRVPGDVLVADAEAEYNNGVLEVRLPVETEAETGHRIDID